MHAAQLDQEESPASRKGRGVLLGAMVVLMSHEIWIMVWTSRVIGWQRPQADIVRLGLTGLFLFFIYRGHRWARWFMAIPLMVFGLLMLVQGAFASVFAGQAFVTAVVYMGVGGAFAFEPNVSAFLKHQRLARKGGSGPPELEAAREG